MSIRVSIEEPNDYESTDNNRVIQMINYKNRL